MNQLCCRACRVRFTPSATAHANCPRCGAACSSVRPQEAMGYSLSEPADLRWRAADLDALARAVANVSASSRQPPVRRLH